MTAVDGRAGGTCLVTGGAGFIGTALRPLLTGRFARTVVLDNLLPQVHGADAPDPEVGPGCAFVRGDVTDPVVWDELLATVRPDVVVHLAAETGTGQSLTSASRHALVNVVGTTRMLDAFARHDVVPRSVVLTSSRAVYGEGAWRADDGTVRYPGQRTRDQLEAGRWSFDGLVPLPHRADGTEPHPTSVYGATKLAQEHVLRAWCVAMGSTPVVLRLQNVYGPGQSLDNPYTGIVPFFAQVARDGGSIPVFEDGDITRDFVFIDDVAAAVVAALDAGNDPGTAYDVGSGSGTTVHELARVVAGLYGAPEPTVTGQFRHGDVRHAAADVSGTQAALGWRPTVGVAEGVRRLCAWIDEERTAR